MFSLKQASVSVLLAFIVACQDSPISPQSARSPEPSPTPATKRNMSSGWILREGTPVRVSFEIRDQRAIFEGDIDLGPADRIASTREALEQARRGGNDVSLNVVSTNTGLRWPNGRVPYVIDADFPNQQRLVDAFAMYAANVAGVYFAPRQAYDNNYVRFRRTDDITICGSSQIGMVGGTQSVFMSDNCSAGVVVHELNHALGIYHEQSRCDRNSFVEILFANIEPGRADQFEQYCGGGKADLLSYDEGSIMHYRSNDFGRVVNGFQLQTIRSLRGLALGQRDTLSTPDVGSLNQLYEPYPVQDLTNSYPGGVPTIGWSATPRASGYGVNLVVVYQEYDDYSGTSNVYDHTTDAVGVTTQLSLQDTQRSYTGSSICVVYQGIGSSVSYAYYYEVVASVPGGVGTARSRTAAQVAPSSC